MKRVGILFLVLLLNVIFSRALFASAVVISQIKAGNSSAPRLIELYNNTENAVDVTDWCVYYASAASNPAISQTTPNERACFHTTQATQRLVLPARSYIVVSANITGLTGDFTMTEGLGSGSSGHVFIADAGKAIQDIVGWGTAQYPEQASIINPSPYIIERKQATLGMYQDTDNNAADFAASTLRANYQVGALTEATDVCLNLEGYQSALPEGYEVTDGHNCTLLPVDICLNIDGVQAEVPAGYQVEGSGECTPTDPAPDPNQGPDPIPSNIPLEITELLPNAIGADEGAEFIEIHNPNSTPIGLDGYQLNVGPGFEKHYSFPPNTEIGPEQYLAFYNSEINFTLVNTTSRVRLVAPTGAVVSTTESYQDPADGQSWSLFDDGWKITDSSTPNAPNQYTLNESTDETSSTGSTLTPCRADQYRNPLTNRCKLKASASGVLKACAADQVRNPETNRCRKLSTAVTSLSPCKVGQERNPETNRCRKIGAGTSSLKPCQPGYERNPETNRCRKGSAKLSGALAEPAAISPINLSSRIIVLLVAMALAYGAYEYKTDIKHLIDRLRSKRGDPRPPG